MLCAVLLILLQASSLLALPATASLGEACVSARAKGICAKDADCPYSRWLQNYKGPTSRLCGKGCVCCRKEEKEKYRQCLTCEGCNSCVAGYGGQVTRPEEFPHMAHLGYGPTWQLTWECGGSLISDRFVLTAAHCGQNRAGTKVSRVRLGKSASYSIIVLEVDEFIPHLRYIKTQEYNDIALIKLRHSVLRDETYAWYMRPVCLESNKNIFSNATATGWGATEKADSSEVLLKMELPPLKHVDCSKAYSKSSRLPRGIDEASMLCAGGFDSGVDTCQGDSGGPLQIQLDDGCAPHYSVIGITSFGIRCGIVPGVYTRVAYFLPWIESIVWPVGQVEDTTEPEEPVWTWKYTESDLTPCKFYPDGRIQVGTGPSKSYVYLGRVYHNGHLVPATVLNGNKTHPAVFTFGGQLLSGTIYEVMCGEGVAWKTVHGASSSKRLSAAALPVGRLSDGTPLYACRQSSYGHTTVGVVDPVTHTCNYTKADIFKSTPPVLDGVGTTDDYELLIEA